MMKMRKLVIVTAVLTVAAFLFSACAGIADGELSAEYKEILAGRDYVLKCESNADGVSVTCTEKDGVYAVLEEYSDHSIRRIALNGEAYVIDSREEEPAELDANSFSVPDFSTLQLTGTYRENGSLVESYSYDTTTASGSISFKYTGGKLKSMLLSINGSQLEADVAELKAGADMALLDFIPPKSTPEYHSIAKIKDRGALKVYTQQFSYAWFKEPLERDEDGNVTKWGDGWYGWEYEYMFNLAKSLGVELEIFESEFDPMMKSVKDGDADAAMCGVLVSNYDDGTYTITEAYNDFESVYFPIVKAKGAKLDSYEQLSEKTIAVWDRTAHMQSAEAAFPKAALKGCEKLDDTVAAVLNGQADAALITLSSLDEVLNEYSGLECSEYSAKDITSGKGIFVMKDNTELAEYFNGKIEEYTKSGDAEKWRDEAYAKAQEWGLE